MELRTLGQQLTLMAGLTGSAMAQDGPILLPPLEAREDVVAPEPKARVKANAPALIAPQEDARALVKPLFIAEPNPPSAVVVRQSQKASPLQTRNAEITSFTELQKLLQDTLTDLRTDIPYTHIDYLAKLINEVKDQNKPSTQEIKIFTQAIADTKTFAKEFKAAQAKGLVSKDANVFQEGNVAAAKFLISPSGRRFTPEGSLGTLFFFTRGEFGRAYKQPKPTELSVGTDINSPYSKFYQGIMPH